MRMQSATWTSVKFGKINELQRLLMLWIFRFLCMIQMNPILNQILAVTNKCFKDA